MTDLLSVLIGASAFLALRLAQARGGDGKRSLRFTLPVGVLALVLMTVWAWHTNKFSQTCGPFVALGMIRTLAQVRIDRRPTD